jgi:hypothetical protein
MAIYTKHLLSGSANGRGILITGTNAASAQSVHSAPGGTTSLDEVFLYACNVSTANVTLNVLWGGVTEPNDQTSALIVSNSGRNLVMDGRLINAGLVVSCYATGTNVVVDGFVNRIIS